jgi:hypothetical protein
VSAKKIAKLYEENLGLSEFELVQDNIRVAEQQQTQNVNAQAQEQLVKGIAERQSDDDIAAEEE